MNPFRKLCLNSSRQLWDRNSRVESTWHGVNRIAESGIRLRTTGQHPFFVLFGAVFYMPFGPPGRLKQLPGAAYADENRTNETASGTAEHPIARYTCLPNGGIEASHPKDSAHNQNRGEFYEGLH